MHATRIRALRTAEGLTQERLAESSGIAVRTIQRLEAGDEGSLETLNALATALGVSVRDLLNPVNDPDLRSAMDQIEERDRLRSEKELQRRIHQRALIRGVIIAIAVAVALMLLFVLGVLAFGIATHLTTPATPETAIPLTGTPEQSG